MLSLKLRDFYILYSYLLLLYKNSIASYYSEITEYLDIK